MPTLDWIGKSKVINHHQEVPYRVLERRYAYGDADSGNMIIHGDNLDALKALLPRYESRVKCVYIDPPLSINPLLCNFDQLIFSAGLHSNGFA